MQKTAAARGPKDYQAQRMQLEHLPREVGACATEIGCRNPTMTPQTPYTLLGLALLAAGDGGQTFALDGLSECLS